LAVAREVERIDFLHVTLKEVTDALLGDVPDLAMMAVRMTGAGRILK
jgi:hypothetical protein